MQWVRFAILVIVAALLQGGFVNAFAVSSSSIAPDMFLILLVFFAVYSDPYEAVIISFTIGFAADIAGSSLGPHMISFGVIGTVLSDLNRFMTMRKMPYQAVAVFLAGALAGICVHLLGFLQGYRGASSLYSLALWTPAYSAIIGPFLFLPAAWWMRIKTQRFARS